MNEAKLQTLLEKQINKGGVYNIVAGVQSQDGSVDISGAAGIADAEAGIPMTVDTPYLVASITKMYTATVIINLHDQGLLSLDKAISEYLPASLINGIHVHKGKDYSSQIKVYQLVNQTSGLADYFEDKPKGGHSLFDDLKQGRDRAFDIEQVMAMVRGLSPRFEPGAKNGTKASYADTNYQLLGAIIESVTGKSVADNFQEMIFTPLDLKHTYVYDTAAPRPDAPAAVYFKERVTNIPKFLTSNTPDGGIVSTVSENLIFLRAFFDGKLFDKKYFDRMTSRWNSIFFPLRYGYGMMQLKMPRIFSPFRPIPEFIGHSGSTGSFAFYCPKKALYLTGTVNQTASPSRPIRLMIQIANDAE